MANDGQRQYFNDPKRVERWPTREPFTELAIAPLLAAANLKPAMAVADIGCGGGMTTVRASELVGPSGRVVGVDISPAMVALAHSRPHPSSVTYLEADAQTDNLAGGPFDRIISQFGLMFFEDPVAAFVNLASHLKPGGSLHGVVWQEMEHNLSFMAHRMAARGFTRHTEGGQTGQLGAFAFANRDVVDGYLVDAGFAPATWERSTLIRPSLLDEVVTRNTLLLAGIDESVVDEAYDAAVAELAPITHDGIVACPLAIQVFSTTVRAS
jgi:SAM-dependent methyltransferase